MAYAKGSEWRKWDLHIHTPMSMVHEYTGADDSAKWEAFITDLENLPPEFKVIGINDYLFIDGYEKVLDFKTQGRLQNIDAIFPVIEFRIKKFGGHKEFKRVNFHVIFSDKLSVDIIKQQFLNQLYGNYKLAPGNEGIQWNGVINPTSIQDLGKAIKSTVPADKLDEYGSDMHEGFNNLNFDEEKLVDILKTNTYLKGNYLTAVGKTEWDAFAWGDSSIAEKKSVINNVDFVFTSSATIDAFNNAKNKLKEQGVNDLLLDCSDAHRNSVSTDKDRIGKCFTWIKADPTFAGLKQVLHEPERVYVGGSPELRQRISTNPNKFIEKIVVKRIDGCSMPETWYDNFEIELNPSLVAVIGNKGNGKSALTDIIGLVGNSYNDNYSFLTKRKFRNPQPYNKSANVEAKIIWADKSEDGFIRLDSTIDTNRIEKVKYIPQNFLETLCVNEDEHEFENEIKKIIFSHTPFSERLGFANLDELITYKSEVINKELGTIKGEIDELNLKIINLEKKTYDNYKQSLVEALNSKQSEFENHKTLKPVAVAEPKNNPELEKRNKDINDQIADVRKQIEQKAARRQELDSSKANLLLEIGELEKSKQAILNLKNSVEAVYNSQKTVLEKYGLNIATVISYNFNVSSLESILTTKNTSLTSINDEMNGKGDQVGLDVSIEKLKGQLSGLEEKLDEPYRLYQKYVQDLNDWQIRVDAITGDKSKYGTIEYYKDQIKYVEETLPIELSAELINRVSLIKKLFDKKSEIIKLYIDSYKPITDFIQLYGHLMKDYQINVSVEFTLDGFINKFFDHISQGAKGTYIGIEEGNKFLAELIPQYNLNNVDSLIDFLNAIRDSLFNDKRPDQTNTKREIELQLKKGYSVEDLYRFLHNLDYLKPTFKLNLGRKSLTELSPGERGALLLIFYLFLDKDDKPLIIDQPEENLDNQSVYDYLVHFIKEAKKRRQIIIVTHNPNLAVVCDAEQIIHMSIDKVNNHTVTYKSGAIENPSINKTIVDILEGTKPAFNNRTYKYSSVPELV